MRMQQVPCDDIRPDPQNDGHSPHAVETLADDIRVHGVLRPVLLRATPYGYMIVHGERRWRAAVLAGLATVPAYVVQEIGQDDGVAA